jgi:hypothetical protein
MAETRRKFSREFKLEAVRLVTSGGRGMAATARARHAASLEASTTWAVRVATLHFPVHRGPRSAVPAVPWKPAPGPPHTALRRPPSPLSHTSHSPGDDSIPIDEESCGTGGVRCPAPAKTPAPGISAGIPVEGLHRCLSYDRGEPVVPYRLAYLVPVQKSAPAGVVARAQGSVAFLEVLREGLGGRVGVSRAFNGA